MEEGTKRGWTGCLLALVLVSGLALAARADLLRCKGPDGRTVYTDSKALCPGAKPFEPSGAVQQAPGPDAPVASREPGEDPGDRAEVQRRAAEAEQGEAKRWREKRRESEEALRAVAERRVDLDEYVGWCNRGGSVITRDDAGIKRTVSCKAIRSEFAALDGKEQKIRDYLESGLAEECRRAGCLPGWIR